MISQILNKEYLNFNFHKYHYFLNILKSPLIKLMLKDCFINGKLIPAYPLKAHLFHQFNFFVNGYHLSAI